MLLFYRIFFNSVRTYCFFTSIPFPSDKMSNESLHRSHARTKIRLGGFRGPSQAIRKIHLAIDSPEKVSWWNIRKASGFHANSPRSQSNAFYYLPICWHGTPSSERNPVFLRFIFQRFDFRGRNNRVWQVKLYCLTPQTILFGARNNIVPGTFCLFFENEMYSFLKWRTFFRHSVCNHSRFVSRLSDIRKGRVSRKGEL